MADTEEKAVLVAGGNSGLGTKLVRQLLEQNHFAVFASYRSNGDELQNIFGDFNLDSSERVIQSDLTDFSQAEKTLKFANSARNLWGLINLTGESSASRLSRINFQEMQTNFLNNCLPAFNLTKAAFSVFSRPTGGRIIHTSSVTVRRPVPGVSTYVAGKAAVEALTRTTAEEASRFGCTVNALRLGYFDSGMSQGVPKKILDDVVNATAVKRLGHATDLFSIVDFILTEKSSFLNGAILDFDGGLS